MSQEFANPDAVIAQYLTFVQPRPINYLDMMECIQNAIRTAHLEVANTKGMPTEEFSRFVDTQAQTFVGDLWVFAHICNFYAGAKGQFIKHYIKSNVNYQQLLYIINLFNSMRTIGLNTTIASATKNIEDFKNDPEA